MKKLIPVLTLAASVAMFSCQRDYDTPPLNEIPVGSVITLDSLIKMYQGSKIKFEEDISVYATVTMDETDGNIYKEVYIQDSTAALNVRMLSGGGMYEGDYIRIALKGTILSAYQGVMQLDSVDADVNMIKQEAGLSFPAQVTSIQEVNNLGSILQSKLIYLDNVQFLTEELDQKYAVAATNTSASRTLTDCNGNNVIVRTSGFANFADELLAQGNGSITAIVDVYNGSTVQLLVRSFGEINMNGTRCDDGTFLATYKKDFEDNSITSGGWTTEVVTGAYNWEIGTIGGTYAQISNYNGSNTASEAWLISPAFDLSGLTNPVLQFDNAYSYSGAPMEAYISTDFTGSGPVSAANWTKLNPTLSSGFFSWVNSGAIDLNAYKQAGVYVAFRYTGTDTNGSTWEVDNILIREN